MHKSKQDNLNPEARKIYNELMTNPNQRGFSNKTLVCAKCRNEFSRNSAMIWLKISRKLGEETAIQNYREQANGKKD